MRNSLTKIAICGVILIGLLIRLLLINKLHVNGDEINFYEIGVLTSFKEILQLKYWAIDYPQLYFLMIRFFSLITNELIHFKIANQFFYLISAIFIYKIGNNTFKDKIYVLFPVILYATSSYIIENDINVNPYSAAFALSCVIVFYYLKLKARVTLINILKLGLAIAVGSFISYSMFFVILSIGLDALITNFYKKSIKNLEILGAIVVSSTPSIFQLLQSLSGFSSLTPEDSNLSNTLQSFINSFLPTSEILLRFVLIIVVLTLSLVNIVVNHKKMWIFLMLILGTIIPLFIFEKLDLFLSVRLLYPIFISLIFLTINEKAKFNLINISVTIILVMLSIIFMINKPSYKRIYQNIAGSVYKICSADTTIIIDSSNFNYYSLYHYYFNRVRIYDLAKYECILGRSTIFESTIKRSQKWVYGAKRYFFINMNSSGNNLNNFRHLCVNAVCCIYNPRLMKFERLNNNLFTRQYLTNFID